MNGIKIHFIVDMDERSAQFCPPMGVGYLSSYLKKHMENISITLSFLSDDIMKDVENYKPDVVGISSTSRYFTQLKALGENIHNRFRVPIIWGGVHVSIAPNELPSYSEVGVLGEGEETAVELLSHFRNGRFINLETIKSIVYRSNDRLAITEMRPAMEPLDRVNSPDLDLFRVRWDNRHRGVMITSRGCPYKCRFCASSLFWNRTRLHSPEYVVQQLKNLVENYQVSEILIYDDFFTINKKRIAKISEMISSDPILKTLRFECLSRVDNFDEELAVKLRAMGVYQISFGIESGCQKTLDYLKNKTVTLKQVTTAVTIAKEFGFKCVGSFIIGSPFETPEDIDECFSFIKNLKLDNVQITIATPFPGTQLWEDAKKIGKISGDAWSDEYYALFSSEENFPFFSGNLYTKYYDFLKDKKLVTQIERAVFVRLVVKGVKLQQKVNFRIKQALLTVVIRHMPKFALKLAYRVEDAWSNLVSSRKKIKTNRT